MPPFGQRSIPVAEFSPGAGWDDPFRRLDPPLQTAVRTADCPPCRLAGALPEACFRWEGLSGCRVVEARLSAAQPDP